MSMFEKATRQKLRFTAGTGGQMTTEDLWDLPLEGRVSLNQVAKVLNREIKAQEEENFVSTPTAANATATLAFDVVKHVIDVKRKEKEKREKAAETRRWNQKILELRDRKKDKELEEKSIEELDALLKPVEEDSES